MAQPKVKQTDNEVIYIDLKNAAKVRDPRHAGRVISLTASPSRAVALQLDNLIATYGLRQLKLQFQYLLELEKQKGVSK